MIIKTNKEKYKISKYLSLIIPHSFEEKISDMFKLSSETFEKNQAELKRTLTFEDVKDQVANVKNLTFCVTHRCNMRCKYCAYGGKYDYNRVHNINSMDLSTYKKAIDLFFRIVNSPSRSERDDLVIGFYGGEPLLEFNNILKACDYVDEVNLKSPIQRNVLFLMTTNGLLLTRERSRNLLEKGFRIDISIDGPKDQNDKFRVKVDKTGTFDELIRRISDFEKKDMEKIRFLLTIHPFHDIKRIEEFFLSNDNLFSYNNVLFSRVSLYNLNNRYKKTWQKAYLKQQQQIDNELDKEKWFYKKMVNSWLDKFYTIPTHNLAVTGKFTGACFPSIDKMYVDVDGSIHMCERIHSNFPIGHIDTGLDYEVILKIKNQWNQNLVKMICWECEAWWLCNFCYATQAKCDSIIIEKKDCNNYIKSVKKSLTDFINSLEEEDEYKNSNCYSSINHYLESL